MGLFYNDPEPIWGILYALNSLQVCTGTITSP